MGSVMLLQDCVPLMPQPLRFKDWMAPDVLSQLTPAQRGLRRQGAELALLLAACGELHHAAAQGCRDGLQQAPRQDRDHLCAGDLQGQQQRVHRQQPAWGGCAAMPVHVQG